MEVNPSEGLGPSHMTHAQREWDGRIQACTRRKNYKILQSGTINDGVVNVFAACTRRRNYKIQQLRNAIGKDADTAGSQIKPRISHAQNIPINQNIKLIHLSL